MSSFLLFLRLGELAILVAAIAPFLPLSLRDRALVFASAVTLMSAATVVYASLVLVGQPALRLALVELTAIAVFCFALIRAVEQGCRAE